MKKLLLSHYQSIKLFYTRYERWLMPATLLVGFLVDYITFTSIQINVTFALLLGYWLLAGIAIAFINFYDIGKFSKKFQYVRLFMPLVVQFAFGALLGSSLIFYWLSGSFSVSWPIITIVALLMVFNDVFRHYFLKPIAQVGLYFFATFSLLSLFLPFLFTSLSFWTFVVAGVISVGIFFLLIIFFPFRKEYAIQEKRQMVVIVFAIFLVMNILYFTNIIPPIPLSLREAGMYHGLKKIGSNYIMSVEPESFWQALIPGQVLHVRSGEVIYFYTAIFAPAKLEAQIFHDWQYYDTAKKDWISQDTLSFTIAGGRKEGYKGYSYRSNFTDGKWRIYVKNERGQVLGRMRFDVKMVEGEVKLQEVVR